MAKLDDERVEKTKSEYQLNQEALMETLTQLVKFVKFARAGKF
jgi:hypothetical protein